MPRSRLFCTFQTGINSMDVNFQRLLVTFVAAVITMLATGLGAVPFFFLPQLSEKWSRWGYAFASGVMLSASVFDLLMPAVQRGGYGPALAGLGVGTVVFLASEEWLGDRDIKFGKLQGASARRILLILGTLFIHSFPEGVAVGVGYGVGEQDSQLGILLALAISIQNIPEGLAIALPLKAEGGFYLAMRVVRPFSPACPNPSRQCLHFWRCHCSNSCCPLLCPSRRGPWVFWYLPSCFPKA